MFFFLGSLPCPCLPISLSHFCFVVKVGLEFSSPFRAITPSVFFVAPRSPHFSLRSCWLSSCPLVVLYLPRRFRARALSLSLSFFIRREREAKEKGKENTVLYSIFEFGLPFFLFFFAFASLVCVFVGTPQRQPSLPPPVSRKFSAHFSEAFSFVFSFLCVAPLFLPRLSLLFLSLCCVRSKSRHIRTPTEGSGSSFSVRISLLLPHFCFCCLSFS